MDLELKGETKKLVDAVDAVRDILVNSTQDIETHGLTDDTQQMMCYMPTIMEQLSKDFVRFADAYPDTAAKKDIAVETSNKQVREKEIAVVINEAVYKMLSEKIYVQIMPYEDNTYDIGFSYQVNVMDDTSTLRLKDIQSKLKALLSEKLKDQLTVVFCDVEDAFLRCVVELKRVGNIDIAVIQDIDIPTLKLLYTLAYSDSKGEKISPDNIEILA